MRHLLINEVGHHPLLELLGQDLLPQGVVVDQDRQVDQDHHHGEGHHQLIEVVVDLTLQLDYRHQLTAILTTKTTISIVKVWD